MWLDLEQARMLDGHELLMVKEGVARVGGDGRGLGGG